MHNKREFVRLTGLVAAGVCASAAGCLATPGLPERGERRVTALLERYGSVMGVRRGSEGVNIAVRVRDFGRMAETLSGRDARCLGAIQSAGCQLSFTYRQQRFVISHVG